jgi:hypothetical protein
MVPGPGTRLLTEYLGSADPCALLADRHPPGSRLHRLARALGQCAGELDADFARAQQAGRELAALRRPDASSPGEVAAVRRAVEAAAVRLEMGLERCEAADTALIRLLAVYQDLGQATHPSAEDLPGCAAS